MEREAMAGPLLNATEQAILTIDPRGRIILANAAAEQMFGYSREELIGENMQKLIPHRFRNPHAEYLARWFSQPYDRPTHSGVFVALGKDGSEFPVDISLSAVGNNEETLGVAFVSSIRELRQSAQALEEQRAQLTAEVTALVGLRELCNRLWRIHELKAGLEEVIDAGMAALGADMGNIQLLNPKTQMLEIVAWRGLDSDFLEYFREVSAADDSACGRSLRARQRIVIEDVELDEGYTLHRDMAAAAGYRAVQSTPLFGIDSEPIGMFSTHFRKPHRSSERDLSMFDLYANEAAEFIERLRSEQQARNLGALFAAQETANRELARELHDVFSQELAALAMEVSTLLASRQPGRTFRKSLEELGRKIGSLADKMHGSSRQLHPSILRDLGLEAAIRGECDQFSEQTDIPVEFTCEELPAPLPEDVALCLFRVVQESLLNVRKHAGANEVRMQVRGESGGVSLRIEDNGNGFDPAGACRRGGLGLISIEERVRLANGRSHIGSQPGQGAAVEVFVPLNPNAP
jgi:PAS domain S-box-containing protein